MVDYHIKPINQVWIRFLIVLDWLFHADINSMLWLCTLSTVVVILTHVLVADNPSEWIMDFTCNHRPLEGTRCWQLKEGKCCHSNYCLKSILGRFCTGIQSRIYFSNFYHPTLAFKVQRYWNCFCRQQWPKLEIHPTYYYA